MYQSPCRYRVVWLTRPNGCVLSLTRPWLWPLAAALFFLLAPLVTLAQKTPKATNGLGTSLKGTVTTQNGDVLAGATVKLAKDPPIGAPATAETDENGHYEFHNLQFQRSGKSAISQNPRSYWLSAIPPMKSAWIITQEGPWQKAEVVGILSARKSASTVKDYIEWLYGLLHYSPDVHFELANYNGQWKPYEAEYFTTNTGIPGVPG